MKKSYCFGNVHLTIEADRDFEDGEQLNPFVFEEDGKITCSFKKADELILPEGKLVYASKSVRVFKTTGGFIKTYTMPLLNAPAAVISKTDSGYYCEYDEKYADYFNTGVNLLNSIGIERIAFDAHMFIFHCSLVEYKGQAILFTGVSGSGKSTRAEMWKKELGAEIINGDKAGLFYENGTLMACGLPVAGSSGIFVKKSLPVRAVVTLKKASDNSTRKAEISEALKEVYYNMIVNKWDSVFSSEAVSFAAEILNHIYVYISECNLDPSSVKEQLASLGID